MNDERNFVPELRSSRVLLLLFHFVYRSEANNDTGKAELVKTFKLCEPLKTADDINKFIDWLANIYINLAMVNYPYPTNFLAPLPGYPVREFCSRTKVNASDENILKQLSYALEMYTNGTGTTKCNRIEETTKELGELGWDFQV